MFTLIVLYLVFVAFFYYAFVAGRSTWILTHEARLLMVFLGLLALVAGIIQTVLYFR